ncbi:uncharacterized protein CDAR_35231 [Caerostris darwini]|uniref:Uncharacterized protein n=1 Tax=Caerostris darwini TaxID=1538125 RepID=A0AAV4SPK8_9ARAC|nr:uncharacterized protein CDAR_35231 [Caerostris darwini]
MICGSFTTRNVPAGKPRFWKWRKRVHVMYYIQHLICHYVQKKRNVSLLTGLVFQEEQMPNSEQIGKQAGLAKWTIVFAQRPLSRCTDAISC